ncbi:MAG: YbhB/YbcL family Raf kinase inhibitor-like protein [Haloarculaceae archaeon]
MRTRQPGGGRRRAHPGPVRVRRVERQPAARRLRDAASGGLARGRRAGPGPRGRPRARYHWGVWNVAPGRDRIPEGWDPDRAVVARNDFGDRDYGGPDPSRTDHRYEFRLYALPSRLDLVATATVRQLATRAEEAAIARDTLRGVYLAPSD